MSRILFQKGLFYLRKYKFQLSIGALFALLSTMYMWPMLQKPAFNVIDDGWSLYVAKNSVQSSTIQGWVDQILIQEASVGRVRPLYYLYYIFLWFFSGTNPLGYWVAQTVLVFGLLVGVYVLEKSRSLTQVGFKFIFVSGLLFFPSIVTNYFRLGTAEPRQVLLLLLFIVWLFALRRRIQSKIFVASGFLLYIASLLAKETSLSLFPAIIVQLASLFFLDKKNRKTIFFVFLFFSIVSLLFLLVFTKVGSTGYGAGIGLNPSLLKLNFLNLRINHREELLLLSISTFLVAIQMIHDIRFKKKLVYWLQTYTRLAVYFSILLGQLIFLLLWSHQMERYFLIFDVLLILIFLHSFAHFFYPQPLDKKRVFYFLVGLFCWVLGWHFLVFKGYFPSPIQKLQNAISARTEHVCSYQENGQLIRFLLSTDFSNTHIYSLHNDYEVVYEINLFATRFNSQYNLRVISNNIEIVRDFSSKFPQLTYSQDVVNEYNNDRNQKKIMLARSETQASIQPTAPKGEKVLLYANHNCDHKLQWVVWK